MAMNAKSGRNAVFFAMSLTGFALTASGASAHAQLVSADPAPNASIGAPQTIQLHFNEALERKFSNFKLTDVDGTEVKITAVDMKDAKTLAAKPEAPLVPGLYTVSWTAVGDDSHRLTGNFSFTVK